MIPQNDEQRQELKEALALQDIADGRHLERVLRWCGWCGRRNPPGELFCSDDCERRWDAEEGART